MSFKKKLLKCKNVNIWISDYEVSIINMMKDERKGIKRNYYNVQNIIYDNHTSPVIKVRKKFWNIMLIFPDG